jgi:hypothetical protein
MKYSEITTMAAEIAAGAKKSTGYELTLDPCPSHLTYSEAYMAVTLKIFAPGDGGAKTYAQRVSLRDWQGALREALA